MVENTLIHANPEHPVDGSVSKESKKAAAAAAKNRILIKKKQLKNLKSKDLTKKREAFRFCIEDEEFIHEPEVVPLMLGFLMKVKMPEMVLETLSTFVTLLSGYPISHSVEQSAETNIEQNGISHREQHARYLLEQITAGEDIGKGTEIAFVQLFGARVTPEIRIRAITVYELLLKTSIVTINHDKGCQNDILRKLQTNGAPTSSLIACLETDDANLQHRALCCLQVLVSSPSDGDAVLHNFAELKGIQRVLAFASHAERRFHGPTVAILESFSQLSFGREMLKQRAAQNILAAMLAEAIETIGATSTAVISGGVTTSSLNDEDASKLCASIPVISRVFIRIQFAKNQPDNNIDSDETLNATVVDTLITILQRDLATALSPPKVSSLLPGQPSNAAAVAAASASAANAAALAALFPFNSDYFVASLSSLGRMIAYSENCKTRAKDKGVMPILLECFKLQSDDKIRQVADKLLHICATTLETDPALGQTPKIDPRLLSVMAEDPVTPRNPPEDDIVASKEKGSFLTVENVLSILEMGHVSQNKALSFCIIRWLGIIIESPSNAEALGEKAIAMLLKILLDTSHQQAILCGYLSKCIEAIVSHSSGALELCGNETLNPVAYLITFLQSSLASSIPTSGNIGIIQDQLDQSINDGDQPDQCLLEWLDEVPESAIFPSTPLLRAQHTIDPYLCASRVLLALVTSVFKWNPSITTSQDDFSESLGAKIESANAAIPGGPPVKGSAIAASKKKLDVPKSAVIGESTVVSVLNKSLQVLKLIPDFSTKNPDVCVTLLKHVTSLMKLPGGIKAILQLAAVAGKLESRATFSKDQVSIDESIPESSTTEVSSLEMQNLNEWPLGVDCCFETAHFVLLSPILQVLESTTSSFVEIEAAIDVIDMMTMEIEPIEANVGSASDNSSILESDRFVNVAIASGALVYLIAFLDCYRVPECPNDFARLQLMMNNIEKLALKWIRLYQTKEQTRASSMFVEPRLVTPNGSVTGVLNDTTDGAASHECNYKLRWATELLDLKVDVVRFGYYGYSPLLLASELEHNEISTALLEAGSSPNTSSSTGKTPLIIAFLTGNEGLVCQLLQAGANVDAMTTSEQDLCVWNCAIVAPLGQDLSKTITSTHLSYPSAVPLSSLIEFDSVHGSPTLLSECLRANVDVNTSNGEGNFLLHALVSRSLVRENLRGLDICWRYHSRQINPSLLLEIVSALVEQHGANVNACNLAGQTPLHLALLYGHSAIIELLLNHGASPSIQDCWGYLPLHYACLGFCSRSEPEQPSDPESTALDIVRLLLKSISKFGLVMGKHQDERKHKTSQEKDALMIEQILEDGFRDITAPHSITVKHAAVHELLMTSGFTDGLLPWHFVCGAISHAVSSTLCLDDDMQRKFEANAAIRVAILRYLIQEHDIDTCITVQNGMNALHLAIKSDVSGCNEAIIGELLIHRDIDVNAVHDMTQIDKLPVIPEGFFADVTTPDCHATGSYVSSRTLDGRYHVIFLDGKHVDGVIRDQLRRCHHHHNDRHDHSHYKYLLTIESAFAPLHYALQTSDSVSLRLLALPQLSLVPEGSDVPPLALACAARRSSDVVRKLINQQANMRVQLPLINFDGSDYDDNSEPAQKHMAALHYAVLYEDVKVTRTLVEHQKHVNVNVRRSGDGFTPLHLACEMGNMELVKLLVHHGANLAQAPTRSSATNTTTALQLLIKNDNMENIKLKELVAEGYVTQDLLLEGLGGKSKPRGQHQEAVGDDVEEDEISCLLLEEEAHNLDLYNHVQESRVDPCTAQSFARRLECELQKSNDVLNVFFNLFPKANELFGKLTHRHECFRQRLVRSQWVSLVDFTAVNIAGTASQGLVNSEEILTSESSFGDTN